MGDIDEFEQVRSQLSVLGDGRLTVTDSLIGGAGLGLFAAVSFARGDPITEYYGQIISKETAAKRRFERQASHIRVHSLNRSAIDGNYHWNGVRIVDKRVELIGRGVAAIANHSADAPNVEYAFVDSASNRAAIEAWMRPGGQWTMRDECRITYIRAIRAIKPGEELLVNYGQDYSWSKESESSSEEEEESSSEEEEEVGRQKRVRVERAIQR